MATETVEIRDKQIVIERFSKQLIPRFLELFRSSFGKSISEDHLRKKYATQDLGGSYFGYMAFHNNRPIAYYGVLPVPFILSGKKLTAVQSADTMTHPDYRRHGLFPLLAKKTYQLAKNEGASFVFGWPNENSYPSFKNKLGWIDLGKMQRFSFKVRTLPAAKIAYKLSWFSGLYQRLVRATLRDHGIKSLASIDVDNTAERSVPYLSYKEKQGCFPINTIVYGNVIINLDYRLKVGSFSSRQLNDFPMLLKVLERKCRMLGITEIQFIASPNSQYISVLENFGFRSSDDLPLMYHPFSDDVKIEKLNLTGLDYDGF